MESLDFTKAPPEFQEVKYLSDILLVTLASGWLVCYFATIRTAFCSRACWMPLLPLSCNVAWELVFITLYPPPGSPILGFWLLVNLGVIYSALRFAPSKASHLAVEKHYLPVLFVLAVGFWAWGHLALIEQLNPLPAFYYGGMACQLMTSAAALSGLVDQGSTQGASYTIWLSRVIGTSSALAGLFFRAHYWPSLWAWADNELMRWLAAAFVILDGVYGVQFWRLRRSENQLTIDHAHRKTE
ncbi:uncharacterized protein N7446_007818 [Penicillium canescens]|uniref:Uncharacterized protein n=1 Tax=Penicillium canescens TaxID=5083 RepID=A0AAD6IM37_PENCN|nr:uncharacterized protein N7446_007818 [Penicillium canescens]KAJ6033885.1 hypothetical protein N7444_011656 [Penicillium canescens]KAJ6056925.1 hypothetical protein N7460_000199 [Penicillium canescens]KAJ6058235.1 hypothetical protein N7446_007818 [Penicillium canescens]